MKPSLILATLALAALTITPAVIDGQRRFRWGKDTQVVELGARLNAFPEQIGDWQAADDQLLSQSAYNMLRPIAYISRVYLNPVTKAQTTIFILMGPTGPTAAHTPDICFASRDFTQLGSRRVVAIDPDRTAGSLGFVSEFRSRRIDGGFLKSWYAWTIDGTWHSPERPRFYFANNRYLFKIQMVARYPSREEMQNDKTFDAFVAEIEQTLRNQVF